jgi:hypothetical protein
VRFQPQKRHAQKLSKKRTAQAQQTGKPFCPLCKSQTVRGLYTRQQRRFAIACGRFNKFS